MNKTIALIPGDGIGPEIVEQAVKVLNAIAQKFGHTFSYETIDMGGIAIDKWGEPLPKAMLEKCRGTFAQKKACLLCALPWVYIVTFALLLYGRSLLLPAL